MALRALQIAVAVVLIAGCGDLPRDPERTLEHVRQRHELRVGAGNDPPFLTREGGEAKGPEADAIRAFAKQLGADVKWDWDSHENHFAALEKYELDLVAGGVTPKTPWSKKVAVTRPFAETREKEKRAWAAPPGENAFLRAAELYLAAHHKEIAQAAGAK